MPRLSAFDNAEANHALVEGSKGAPDSGQALELRDVDKALDEIARTSGPGSARARVKLLKLLFARATPEERGFLIRLLSGELRQGALEGILTEALARAEGKTLSAVVQDALRQARIERRLQELRGIQGYWSRKARDRGILTERDLDRYLSAD